MTWLHQARNLTYSRKYGSTQKLKCWPATLAQACRWAQLRNKHGRGVNMRCRVLRRHGVIQGTKQEKVASGSESNLTNSNGSPLMVAKIRMIDDSKRSLSNSMLHRCCESIAPCRFTYLAYVADEPVTQCAAANRAVPKLVCSIDNME